MSFMSRRMLNILILILFVALIASIWASDRGISGAMESIGNSISRLFD